MKINEDMKQFFELLKDKKRILLSAHVNPDGDATGSVEFDLVTTVVTAAVWYAPATPS